MTFSRKCKAFGYFKFFHQEVDKLNKHDIVTLRSKNGGEFTYMGSTTIAQHMKSNNHYLNLTILNTIKLRRGETEVYKCSLVDKDLSRHLE